MLFSYLGRSLRLFGFTLGLAVLLLSLATTSPPRVSAQAQPNQTYDCGTYGTGDYGQNDCLAASDTTPIPSATPDQEAPDGFLPDSGASLGWWAGVGALLIALGLGFYGYSSRQKRRNGRTN